jgi:hypothetical protein
MFRHGSARFEVSEPGRAAAARLFHCDEVIEFLESDTKMFPI